MSDAELLQEALRRFPAERWTEYEALLVRRRQAGLTAQEQMRLEALRREADILTFRKGYAAVLLKRRGYRPPSLEELRPFPSLIRGARTGQSTLPGTSRAHKSSD